MKISPHFSRSEFACKCGCGFDTVDCELLTVAEVIRDYMGAFTPNSGARCKEHNTKIGGSPKSQHLLGKAMDVPTSEPGMLYNYLDNLFYDKYGIGLYKTFVHIDVREKKARW